jgi:YHYH protein
MKKTVIFSIFSIVMLMAFSTVFLCISCKKEEATTTPTTTTSDVTISIDTYKKVYGATEVYAEGDFAVVKTTNIPDHKSPYFQGTQWEATKYEAYNGTNTQFKINPNRIAAQNITFKFPLKPVVDASHPATPGGAIGIAINGVVIFNQYAAMNAPLTGEINGFDQYNAHPQQQGSYHYHVEPLYLTKLKGKSALLGFLLDGFPVYGTEENGKTITNADLDAYHGHTSATTEFPNGIYHYHFTTESPYLNGSGFYGKKGTVSQ